MQLLTIVPMIQFEQERSNNMGNAVMKLIRLNQVLALTGLSRGTTNGLERAGSFHLRRRLGPNSVAWPEHEITACTGPSGLPSRTPPSPTLMSPRSRINSSWSHTDTRPLVVWEMAEGVTPKRVMPAISFTLPG